MATSNITYGMYRYRIADFIIQTGPGYSTTYYAGYDNVQSIIIDKNFDELMLPMLMVEVSIPNFVHRAMKSKDNTPIETVVTFKLQKGPAEEALDLEETKNASFSNFISGKFYALITDKSPDVLDKQIERHEKEDTEVYKKGMDGNDLVIVKMLLYNYQHWKSLSSIVNNVITSCTLIDALTFVANKAGLNNILLSPPDNFKTYKEFIITPITPMEQLDRICNDYGFHKTGSVIFFDFKYIYILDKGPECTAYTTNEYKFTYLMSKSNTSLNSTVSSGCASDSKTKTNMLNIIGNSIQVESLSEANNQIYGNNFMIIDTKSGEVKSVDSNTGAPKTGQVVMINSGDDTSGAVQRELYEASNIITLGFSHIDLDMLSPNKCFITSFDDPALSKYNGKVRLSRMSCIFAKEGAYYVPQVTCKFKG